MRGIREGFFVVAFGQSTRPGSFLCVSSGVRRGVLVMH